MALGNDCLGWSCGARRVRVVVGLVAAGLLSGSWVAMPVGADEAVESPEVGELAVEPAPVIEGDLVTPVAPVEVWDPATYEPDEFVWPEGGSSQVVVPGSPDDLVAVGETVVAVTAPDGDFKQAGFAGGIEDDDLEGRASGSGELVAPGAVQVDVVGHADVEALGGVGAGFVLSAASDEELGAAGAEEADVEAPGVAGVGVVVDVSGFDAAYGGDFGYRLQVGRVPGCVVAAAVETREVSPGAARVLGREMSETAWLLISAVARSSRLTRCTTLVPGR